MLGFGTGTGGYGGRKGGSDQNHLDNLSNLLYFAWQNGIKLYDTAVVYETHKPIRNFLRRVPRESVEIMTKQPVQMFLNGTLTTITENGIKKILIELGTSYIDIFLIHCCQSPNFIYETKTIDILNKMKRQGYINKIGISVHDMDAIKVAGTQDWIDVILCPLNYNNISTTSSQLSMGTTEQVVEELKKIKGKRIIAMKVFGEGGLIADKKKCIEWIKKQPIDYIIGMTSEQQILENIEMDKNETSI
jgi:predicted aldo/keto reductase-like oxidoreductase